MNLDDEGLRLRFGDDFRRVYAEYNGPETVLSEAATSHTVFGIERHGLGYGQPISHPLARARWNDPSYMGEYQDTTEMSRARRFVDDVLRLVRSHGNCFVQALNLASFQKCYVVGESFREGPCAATLKITEKLKHIIHLDQRNELLGEEGPGLDGFLEDLLFTLIVDLKHYLLSKRARAWPIDL